jgi:hypothetical protein
VSHSGHGDRPRSHQQIYAFALIAGIVACLISWLAGELTREVFKPRLVTTVFQGMRMVGPSTESQNAADFKNAVLAVAILGGVSGLVLGFAGGLGGRSPVRGAIVGVGALALGSLVGTFASIALFRLVYGRLVPDPNDLLTPIMAHGGVSAATGAVAGAAFAIGVGRWRQIARAMGGALLGAVLATVVFHLLGETFFRDSRPGDPVASSSSIRLLSAFLVAVLTALGAAWGTPGGVDHTTSTSPAETQ